MIRQLSFTILPGGKFIQHHITQLNKNNYQTVDELFTHALYKEDESDKQNK